MEPEKEAWVAMPARLTAENGAKGLLMGEFHEKIQEECSVCSGGGCDICDGYGTIIDEIPVSWNNIKAIYRMAVEHLAKPIANQPHHTTPNHGN